MLKALSKITTKCSLSDFQFIFNNTHTYTHFDNHPYPYMHAMSIFAPIRGRPKSIKWIILKYLLVIITCDGPLALLHHMDLTVYDQNTYMICTGRLRRLCSSCFRRGSCFLWKLFRVLLPFSILISPAESKFR